LGRQEPANERAGDAEKDRDNPTTRIISRHEELCDRADDETKQQPSKDSHALSSKRSSA
jgi:hypothetical protein